MARQKPYCVLCGEETEFFRRFSLPLYNTNQIVCLTCKQTYDCSTREEKDRLKEKMLQSPHLRDGERIQILMKWKQDEEKRRQQKERVNVLGAVRREQVTLCCGTQMSQLGTAFLPIGERMAASHPWMETERLEVSVYECQVCGCMKFFRYEQKNEEEQT